MSPNPLKDVVEVASHGLFAVGDEVIADRPVAGYGNGWVAITYCRKGDHLKIIEVRPNGWYHVERMDQPERPRFLIRHREASPANAEPSYGDGEKE